MLKIETTSEIASGPHFLLDPSEILSDHEPGVWGILHRFWATIYELVEFWW